MSWEDFDHLTHLASCRDLKHKPPLLVIPSLQLTAPLSLKEWGRETGITDLNFDKPVPSYFVKIFKGSSPFKIHIPQPSTFNSPTRRYRSYSLVAWWTTIVARCNKQHHGVSIALSPHSLQTCGWSELDTQRAETDWSTWIKVWTNAKQASATRHRQRSVVLRFHPKQTLKSIILAFHA
jgi:hypothetical protein